MFPILNTAHPDSRALVALLKSRAPTTPPTQLCLDVAREVAREWPERVAFARAAGVSVGVQQVTADRLAAVVDLDDDTRSGLEVLGGLDFETAFAVFSNRASCADTVTEALRIKAAHETEATRLAKAKADAARLASPDGTVRLEALVGFDPRFKPFRIVVDHPDCGIVPKSVSQSRAVELLLADHLDKLPNAMVPDGEVQLRSSKAAKRCGLSELAVAYAAGTPGGEMIPHRKLDWILDRLGEPDGAEWSRQVEVDATAALEAREAEKAEVRRLLGEIGITGNHGDLTTTDTAKLLDISTDQVRSAIDRGDLPGQQVQARGHYGVQSFWCVDAFAVVAARKDPPAWLQAIRKRKAKAVARRADLKAEATVRLQIPERALPPTKVEVFLGPTGSGKTHRALQYLAERGAGVYAAPLRMLAAEGHERLTEHLGPGRVGLVTGEERIDPDAPIICCTAEMAPMRAPLLVLDEVQWAADPERGWAWSRLLAGAQVDELYVTGEVGAAPLVRSVLGDDTPITFCQRLVPLHWDGVVSLDEIPDRSVVVAFSAKAVRHLAGAISKGNTRPVAVMYGALPPEVRRAQIARFSSGEAKVMVATDVIGHGMNMPADRVIFAETSKFDGMQHRNLLPWEIAQIAGRAGRFGLSETGSVAMLEDIPGFDATPAPVHAVVNGKAANVSVGDHKAFRKVEKGYVGPGLDDLPAYNAAGLPEALRAWSAAMAGFAATKPWALVQPVGLMLERLAVLKQGSLLSRLDLSDAWTLARSPLDPTSERSDTEVLRAIAGAVLGNHLVVPAIFAGTERAASSGGGTITGLESAARTLTALRWATLAFPGRLNLEHSDVVRALDQVAQTLNDRLNRTISKHVAHCVICGSLCAPWFSECDSCHSSHYDDDVYDDHVDFDHIDIDDDDDDVYNDHVYVSPARSPKVAKSLAEAAGRSRLLERPAKFCRTTWLKVAIPAIEAIEATDPVKAAAIRHKLASMPLMDRSVDRKHVKSLIDAVKKEFNERLPDR